MKQTHNNGMLERQMWASVIRLAQLDAQRQPCDATAKRAFKWLRVRSESLEFVCRSAGFTESMIDALIQQSRRCYFGERDNRPKNFTLPRGRTATLGRPALPAPGA